MNVPFDAIQPGIRIRGYVAAFSADRYVEFTLDTGATRSVLRPHILQYLGCDLTRPISTVQMTAATGVIAAPVFQIQTLHALGQFRNNFPIVAVDLPVTFAADGLLGLDFFRGQILTLDFERGRISLYPPRSRWWPFSR